MKKKDSICTLNLSSPEKTQQPGPTHQRLVNAAAFLLNLERQRAYDRDPAIGKLVEDRIIWRELLDLELQNIDEQIESISAVAAESWK